VLYTKEITGKDALGIIESRRTSAIAVR
jgi:hypothetical protein